MISSINNQGKNTYQSVKKIIEELDK